MFYQLVIEWADMLENKVLTIDCECLGLIYDVAVVLTSMYPFSGNDPL